MPVPTPQLLLTEAQQAVQDHFEVVTLTDYAQGIDADDKKILLIGTKDRDKLGCLQCLYFQRMSQRQISEYNDAPGFRLLGWYKPSKNEGEMCTEAHSIHVVQLKVNGDETDARKYAAHVSVNADGNTE